VEEEGIKIVGIDTGIGKNGNSNSYEGERKQDGERKTHNRIEENGKRKEDET